MIQPNDAINCSEENWEAFKKEAIKDELYYSSEGDLLDTAEGRSKFCKLNDTSVYRKPDPNAPGYKIWVFNNKGIGMVVKKRSKVDPSIMENIEYNSDGIEISKSYEPA